MKLPAFAVNRFVTVIMIFLAILILGSAALFVLPIDLLPEIEIPAISIVTVYPGASAEDVESKVTKKIEDFVSTVNNLDEITSTSLENISLITAKFDWNTNLDEASNDIRDKLDQVKENLPDDADNPIVFKINTSQFPVLVYGATATENMEGLYHLIDKEVTDRLKRVPGVGNTQIIGGLERQVRVDFDPERIEAYNLNINAILGILAQENLDLPAGTMKMNNTEYTVRIPGEFDNPDQVKDVVVGVDRGKPIHLRDVADVSDSFKERTEDVRVNGVTGLVFMVQKQSGANSVNVVNRVRERVSEITTLLPDDIKLTEIFDTSVFIRQSLTNLSEAVVVGGIIVILVILAFLRRFRSSMIIALTIPFSLIIAFGMFFLFDYTINMVTLMSLAIAIGLVVDDAIVILENITRHVESGDRPFEAAEYGASEVGLAVMAATLSIVVVFAPMLFATGLTGIMFSQLSATVIVTILGSLLASLTLTPALASRLLRKETNDSSSKNRMMQRVFAITEQWFAHIETGYSTVLSWALSNKKKTLGIIVAVFVISLGLIPFISTEFIPEGDTGDLQINYEMAPGTRMENTAEVAHELEQVLRDSVPECTNIFSRYGQSTRAGAAAFGRSGGSHVGMVGGKLVERKLRDRSTKDIAEVMRRYIKTIPGVLKVDIDAGNPLANVLFGGDKPITVEIAGHDIEQTNALAEKILAIVRSTPGTRDAKISRPLGKPEFLVNIDREKAALLGTNVADIANALRTQVYGTEATKYREAGDEYEIFVRAKEKQRNSIEDLEKLIIATRTDTTVRLGNLATIEQAIAPTEIERKDRERLVKVGADLYHRPLGDVAADVAAELDKLEIPAGIDISFGGSVKEQRENFRDLGLLLLLSLVLVYMVMASQFESFRDPFIIMFSIPFAFVGVIWAFFITQTTLNLMSFIGVIILVGLVVKNAIVLIDYTNILRKRGLSMFNAVTLGGKHRLRPVLMTALTTMFGMLPMALSRNEGSEMWRPLGITVIGGMLVSTLVTLVLIPVVYSIFEGRKNHIEGESS